MRPDLSNWPAGKLSKLVFYSLIALTAVVYTLFYLIGYHRPYEENPNYTAPLFTPLLIAFLLIIVMAAIAISIYSVIRNTRRNKGIAPTDNGIPTKRITLVTSGLTLLILIVTFVFGSSEGIIKNGENIETPFWSRTADMFVNTSLFLITAAILIICANYVIAKKRNR